MHTSHMASVKDAINQKGECNVDELEKIIYDDDGEIKKGADLIQLLELGAMYPMVGEFEKSNRVLESAYLSYTQREERAKINARDTTTDLLDIAVGEGSGDYEMAPYEKVTIHNIKAMNFLMLGRPDAARVEVQRAVNCHQRIKEYAEFEAAKLEKEKASVRKKETQNQIENDDMDAQIRQLTQKAALDEQQRQSIRNLRNAYENGYTYLLSSLVFGLNNEAENARPQLKNARALTGNPYVQRLFLNFQKDPASLTAEANVYVFAQVGFAPTKTNVQVPFYNPISETASNFCLAKIQASPPGVASIEIVDSALPASRRLEGLADLDLLALKQYDEDLTANITKAILRVTFQTLKDKVILDQTTNNGKNLSLFRIEQAILTGINQVLYKADTRAWNLAPKRVLFFCGAIDAPQITLRITDTRGRTVDQKVDIDPKRTNVVSLRCLETNAFVHAKAF